MIVKSTHVRFFLFLVIFLRCLFGAQVASAQKVHLRRICTAQDGKITISWYPFTDTCQDIKGIYVFGRQDAFSPYTRLDSVKFHKAASYVFVDGLNYLQKGSFYIVYLIKCGTDDSVHSDSLPVDINPVPRTDPDSVSVQADGSVVIGWNIKPQGKYGDIKSCISYRVKSGYFPLDTVSIRDGQSDVDKNSEADSKPVSYCIAPVDSCDNVSALGNTHTTIFAQGSQDSCKYSVTLSWSSYLGWKSGVSYYEVWFSKQLTSGYRYAGRVGGNTYTLLGLDNFKQYYFFVRAVKNDTVRITSSSNRVGMVTEFQNVFKYVYIKTVSVEQNNSLRLDWTTSNNIQVGYCELYRGRNTGSMKLITTIPGSDISNGIFTYRDFDVDVSADVFYYKVVAYNTCGHYSGTSMPAHNIVLKVLKNGKIKSLGWNAYDNWSGDVFLYSVYRVVHDSNAYTDNIGQESKFALSFTDEDSFSVYQRPGVCYYIRALEGDSDKYGFVAESYSNTVCYIDAPIVYIPNAFVPDQGVNYVFKPVLSFSDTVNTEMTIYNRWGERVFDTKEITKGWDGKTKDGRWAPSGVYLYDIRVLGWDNTLHTYKGTFTLL